MSAALPSACAAGPVTDRLALLRRPSHVIRLPGQALLYQTRQTFPGAASAKLRLSLSKGVRAQQGDSANSGAAGADSPAKTVSTVSPFAGKKISDLLAARRKQTADIADTPSTKAKEAAAGSSASDSAAPSSNAIPSDTGPALPGPSGSKSLSPTIAALLKDERSTASSPVSAFASSLTQAESRPSSPFVSGARTSSVNAVPASSTKPVVSFGRKSVIEALKAEGGATGLTTRPGQPTAPVNIFKDEIRTKEQIEAEKFRLEISREQLLLALSFFASSLLMLGTVYIVWKLGAIHLNEY